MLRSCWPLCMHNTLPMETRGRMTEEEEAIQRWYEEGGLDPEVLYQAQSKGLQAGEEARKNVGVLAQ
jgi:hypothetical protein